MESGLKLREGETILLEQEVRLVYDEGKKSCLQKLLGCCCKPAKMEGASFIIITNQRLIKIVREKVAKKNNAAEAVSFTAIPPHAVIEYGYNFGVSNSKIGFCCCKQNANSDGGTFFFRTASEIYTLGLASIEIAEKVNEALYQLINK